MCSICKTGEVFNAFSSVHIIVRSTVIERKYQTKQTSWKFDFSYCGLCGFIVQYHLRFDYKLAAKVLFEKLCLRLSNSSFFYGFEYLGASDHGQSLLWALSGRGLELF